MPSSPSIRPLLHKAFLALAVSLLVGCSQAVFQDLASSKAIPVSGNWTFASSSAQATTLPQISGSLSGTSQAITGLFHAATSEACISPKLILALSGSADADSNVTLTSAVFSSGSVLSIHGKLATDGKSISNVSYGVVGGACAFTAVNGSVNAQASATQYQAISGTYSGKFSDPSGNSLIVTATLTQTSQPDANGTFHLTGNASFGSEYCVASSVITDSIVTGSSISATYMQTVNGVSSTIVGSGTFSADASVLTITNWTLSGGCGADSGTGVLTKQ